MHLWIGWTSSVILLLTLIGQIIKQWRAENLEGVSPLLFIGQTAASSGFLIYSLLIGNAVFVVTNGLILFTALAGQTIYYYKQRRLKPER